MLAKKYRYLLLLLACIFGVVFGTVAWRAHWDRQMDGEYEWLITPRFDVAQSFKNGTAWVREEFGGPWTLIDTKGKAIIKNFIADYVRTSFSNADLSFFEVKELWGCINSAGEVVIPAKYERLYNPFGSKLLVAEKNKLRGVIDTNGAEILPIVYEGLIFFDSKMIAVKEKGNEKWGYINIREETVADSIFDMPNGGWLPPSAYLAKIDGKSGLLDENGRWILPPSYDRIYASKEGPIGILKDGKVGFVDTGGNPVIDFQFKETDEPVAVLYNFSEGLAVVLLSDVNSADQQSPFGVINAKGEVLFRLPGAPLGLYSEGFILVQRMEDETYGLVDRTGQWHALPPYLTHRGPPIGVTEGILPMQVAEQVKGYKKYKKGYLKIKE